MTNIILGLLLLLQFTIPQRGGIASSGGGGSCTMPATSLVLDLSAASISTSPFSSWPDTSGASNTTAMTGSPTWSNNTFGTGLAGATFNGSSQYGTLTTAIGGSVYGIYAVVKNNTGAASYLTASSVGNAAVQAGFDSTGHLILDRQNQANIATSTGTVASGTAAEIAALYNSSTGAWGLYINGTLDSGGTNVQAISNPIDRAFTNWNGGAVTPFNGSDYELLIYQNATYQPAVHSCFVTRGLP
jgi:hypothetical protein